MTSVVPIIAPHYLLACGEIDIRLFARPRDSFLRVNMRFICDRTFWNVRRLGRSLLSGLDTFYHRALSSCRFIRVLVIVSSFLATYLGAKQSSTLIFS